jgi:hypothetical protein
VSPCYDDAPDNDVSEHHSRRTSAAISFCFVYTLFKDGLLMHMRKLLPLAMVVVVGTSLQANAQTLEDKAPAPAAASRAQSQAAATPSGRHGVFFNVNFAGQAGEHTFTETATSPKYNETAAVATSHAVGGGPVFDISIGKERVWRSLAVAIGYSRFSDDDDAGVTARVPHPLVFGSPRTESLTASGLEHSENVVHLQFMWMIPYRERFKLALFAGPSFFSVRQDLATVEAGNISDTIPVSNVRISSLTVTKVKKSGAGFNIGADGSYHVREISGVAIGVGLFARFVGASVNLPGAAGATLNDDLEVGGFQGGGGLRLGF